MTIVTMSKISLRKKSSIYIEPKVQSFRRSEHKVKQENPQNLNSQQSPQLIVVAHKLIFLEKALK
jgi:hypothetical protein